MRKLVLFDIDGTLVRDNGASREAYALALREVYGFERGLDDFDFSGRTDPQITHMVLSTSGHPPDQIDAGMERLWERYLSALAVRAVPGRIHALPGVAPLVDLLDSHHLAMLALLTGNIEPGARLKLLPPGLNRYFPFGAFGSDSIDRNRLAPIAVERASRIDGHQFEGRDVVIIGDSIFDVRCGVPHGATTIAVASGRTPADLLRAENPHYFFESLEDTDAVVEAIFANA